MEEQDLKVDDINSENITQREETQKNMKFCKHCGKQINVDAVLCIHCGLQVEELKSSYQQAAPQIIVNNSNNNTNTNTNANTNTGAPYGIKPKNKWVALLLCFFLGLLGVHKFYERKILLGIVYIFANIIFITPILVFIDFIRLLFKPNPYYV